MRGEFDLGMELRERAVLTSERHSLYPNGLCGYVSLI